MMQDSTPTRSGDDEATHHRRHPEHGVWIMAGIAIQEDKRAKRQPVEEVICGLDTTSAKIRALAQAGYDRTEISQQLGIRYQHVRKVLLDAGVKGGLRREVEAEREPVIIDAVPSQREPTSWEVLLRAGFQLLGEWKGSSENAITLNPKAPKAAGVYALVVNDAVGNIVLTDHS